MANWFVDSAAGANSNSGTAFGSPKKYLWLSDGTAGLFIGGTAPAAGDTVYVLKNHSETHTVTINCTHAGTETSPIRCINVDAFNSGSPIVLGPKNNNLVTNGPAAASKDMFFFESIYFYGFKFECADEFKVNPSGGTIHFSGCELAQLRSGGDYGLRIQSTTTEFTIFFDDCVITLLGNLGIRFITCKWVMNGGTITATSATQVFQYFVNGGCIFLDSVDLSSNVTLISALNNDTECVFFRAVNCLLKAATVIAEPNRDGFDIEFYNCSDTAGNLAIIFRSRAGSVDDEATVVRTGGAAYLSTGYSFLYAPSTAVAQNRTLLGPIITGNADFSTAKTIDIFIVNNVRDLQDDEIWFDISFGTSGAGGSKVETNRGTNWLLAPVNHADDTTSTWGGSNTFQQKMSITTSATGRESTYQIKVYLAVDVDVYIDPLPVIS